MFNKISTATVCTALLATQSAMAVELGYGTTANLTLSVLSDYRSNGVSQTRGDPVLQGELSLAHESGLIGGLWASNVDYATKTRLEEGAYIGIFKQPTEDITLTATIGRYVYPKNSSFTTDEFYGAITYKNFRYNMIYDFNQEDAPNAKFQYLSYTFNMPYDTSLLLELGHHDIGNVLFDKNGKSSSTYNTQKVSLKKGFFGADWSVSYIDTDISKTECLYYIGDEHSCQATVVFGVSKTF